jgi:S-disulfanyl-L-cysteine oxidoreductase SoxD
VTAASRTRSAITIVASMAFASALWAGEPASTPLGVGRPVSVQDVAAESLTVLPDGSGLPVGQGTARQGAALYAAHCAACHGDSGEGRGDFPALSGGRGSLATDKPVLTVGSYWPYATTVWDYINRGMPYTDAGTLSADDVYALTAYVLYLNGIVSERKVLDRKTLPSVRMPNRDGFIDDSRPGVSASHSSSSDQVESP